MNNQPSRKFFDVARPGKSAPSSTSRPVVTQTRPANPDPMFHEQPAMPIQAKPEPALPDPVSLLIQSGDYTPLKPSKGKSQRIAVYLMLAMIVVLTIVSYLMVSSLN